MKNLISPTATFINTQLHRQLEFFAKTLPKDTATEALIPLIDALLFALRNGENPRQLISRIRRERYKKEPSLLSLTNVQAALDVNEIKQLRALAKAKTLVPGTCKLERYRQEISQLRRNGASHMDIKIWLLANKSVNVSQSTIHRYLKAIAINVQDNKK